MGEQSGKRLEALGCHPGLDGTSMCCWLRDGGYGRSNQLRTRSYTTLAAMRTAASPGRVALTDAEVCVAKAHEQPSRPLLVRLKWMCDDCRNIDEIIARLEEEVEWYKQRKREGYQLQAFIRDDFGWLTKSVTSVTPAQPGRSNPGPAPR
ncbi:hypothetical protein WJX72_008210 [[Myrmecia] bisecta]|uniref:Uncharacterized protein n=1 Tax=[Myrmecia] bisecta TaxID=41462 RepID=A0AAW1PYC1_9CHLO